MSQYDDNLKTQINETAADLNTPGGITANPTQPDSGGVAWKGGGLLVPALKRANAILNMGVSEIPAAIEQGYNKLLRPPGFPESDLIKRNAQDPAFGSVERAFGLDPNKPSMVEKLWNGDPGLPAPPLTSKINLDQPTKPTKTAAATPVVPVPPVTMETKSPAGPWDQDRINKYLGIGDPRVVKNWGDVKNMPDKIQVPNPDYIENNKGLAIGPDYNTKKNYTDKYIMIDNPAKKQGSVDLLTNKTGYPKVGAGIGDKFLPNKELPPEAAGSPEWQQAHQFDNTEKAIAEEARKHPQSEAARVFETAQGNRIYEKRLGIDTKKAEAAETRANAYYESVLAKDVKTPDEKRFVDWVTLHEKTDAMGTKQYPNAAQATIEDLLSGVPPEKLPSQVQPLVPTMMQRIKAWQTEHDKLHGKQKGESDIAYETRRNNAILHQMGY